MKRREYVQHISILLNLVLIVVLCKQCITRDGSTSTTPIVYRGDSILLKVDTIIKHDSIRVPIYVRDSVGHIDTAKLMTDYCSEVIYADTLIPLKGIGTLSFGLSTQYNRLNEFHYDLEYKPITLNPRLWSVSLGVARVNDLTYGLVGVGYKPKFTDRITIETGALVNKQNAGIYLKTNIHF